MENDYTKYSLQDLREYGRLIGVKSPTSKKKRDLISAIVSVEKGEVEPYSSVRGRPKHQKLKPEKKCLNCRYKNEGEFFLKFIGETQKYLNAMQDLINSIKKQQ